MHENKEFTLYNKVIRYDKYLRKYVTTVIPNVYRDIRIRFLDESYNLIRYLFEAEFTKGNIRIKNITEMLVTLSMLDMLSTELMDILKGVNRKHVETSIGMLTEVKNMVYSWRKNVENNEKTSN